MLGYVVRGIIVVLIFLAWGAFVACEIKAAPKASPPPDAAADAAPVDSDPNGSGYFGHQPVGWE